MADIGPRGQLEAAPTRTEPLAAENVMPLRQKQVQDAATKLDDAHAELADAVKAKDQRRIQQALADINKYEAQTSRLGQPFSKQHIIDIFDPSNVLKEAVARNDWETATKFVKDRDAQKTKSLED